MSLYIGLKDLLYWTLKKTCTYYTMLDVHVTLDTNRLEYGFKCAKIKHEQHTFAIK